MAEMRLHDAATRFLVEAGDAMPTERWVRLWNELAAIKDMTPEETISEAFKDDSRAESVLSAYVTVSAGIAENRLAVLQSYVENPTDASLGACLTTLAEEGIAVFQINHPPQWTVTTGWIGRVPSSSGARHSTRDAAVVAAIMTAKVDLDRRVAAAEDFYAVSPSNDM